MPRIMIIDDDKDLLTITGSSLKQKGFIISVQSEWEAAAKEMLQFKPQVILLDVFLSGLDGLEVCKKLKANTYTRHIPVIIFSGYPRVGEAAIYEFGADGFISKPFETAELVKKIHKVLEKKHESI